MAKRKQTRNAQGSGTIRQRPDGRWEARYTTGRDSGTGKQVQKSVYGATQAEVRKKLQQIAVEIENATYLGPSKMTLGAVKLSELKPHDVQAFLNQQAQDSNDKPALASKSIVNLYGILHKALQQAVQCGYIKLNPSVACKPPRIEKKEINPLDGEQITAFLNSIKGHPFEALYTVDLFTGMRQGELLALTWDCVQGDTLYIYRQLQLMKGEYHFMSLKNNKTRRITPAPAIMRLLREQKIRQMEWQLKSGGAWSNEEGFVFTDELGNHLARQTVYQHFKRIVKSLEMPDVRFHDMHHSYAVAALQAGDDVKTVQENLGHHTAAFTLDVYGHVTEQMKRDSADRMDRFIKNVSSL